MVIKHTYLSSLDPPQKQTRRHADMQTHARTLDLEGRDVLEQRRLADAVGPDEAVAPRVGQPEVRGGEQLLPGEAVFGVFGGLM